MLYTPNVAQVHKTGTFLRDISIPSTLILGGSAPLSAEIDTPGQYVSKIRIMILRSRFGSFPNADRVFLFRLDDLAKALSVIATATWLGGWVAGWLGVRHTPVLYQNG